MIEKKAKKAVFLGIDGADPMLMKRFIDEGYLPNIKKFIEEGAAEEDYSMLGMHPTITPPNWASLATGANPGTHGITCFWNHTLGNELTHLDNGFNSRLCKAEYIWDAAARDGLKSIVFNYPTGWPATNENVIAVDGGGIIPNMHAYLEPEGFYLGDKAFEEVKNNFRQKNNSGDNCIVEDDIDSADFDEIDDGNDEVVISDDKRVDPRDNFLIDHFESPVYVSEDGKAFYTIMMMNHGMQRRYAVLEKDVDGKYNKLVIFTSKDFKTKLGEVSLGKFSDWIYDSYQLDDKTVKVAYKVKLVEMAEDGSSFKLYRSYVLNMDEDKYFYPKTIKQELFDAIGPMMHMSTCEDIDIIIETQEEMYHWMEDAMLYLTSNKEWDLLYCHVHALDSVNHGFQNLILEEYTGEKANTYLYGIMLKFYQITDEFVKRMMSLDDGNTMFVLASDHGGMSKDVNCDIPLIGDPWAVGGKILEDMGYLVVDRSGGKATIDWSKTRAIGQRSGYVYINLKGRDPQGIVEPEEYDELVNEIVNKLLDYKDPKNGERPFTFAFKRDEMKVLGLYGENVGDIYFVFNPRWARVHGTSLTTHSYKGTSVQAFFAMNGAGVKKGAKLNRPIHAIDVVPTICAVTGISVPAQCEGGILYQGIE